MNCGCGACGCDKSIFAKCTLTGKNDEYSFYLCKQHYEIYSNAAEYKVSVELLVK